MATTRVDRVAAALVDTGFTVGARVQGTLVEWVEAEQDMLWEEDSEESYRYTVSSPQGNDGTDDYQELRDMVAATIRQARNDYIAGQDERDAEAATDAVTALIDSGKSRAVIAVLKAAGLI